jgi:hypothetical protein
MHLSQMFGVLAQDHPGHELGAGKGANQATATLVLTSLLRVRGKGRVSGPTPSGPLLSLQGCSCAPMPCIQGLTSSVAKAVNACESLRMSSLL